jgi:hypothetical protein
MLAIIINRAKEDGPIDSLIPHLVEGGVSILKYIDDTILFMEQDLAKALNMKLSLCMYEQLTGLKIIFRKCDFFVSTKTRKSKRNICSCSVVN